MIVEPSSGDFEHTSVKARRQGKIVQQVGGYRFRDPLPIECRRIDVPEGVIPLIVVIAKVDGQLGRPSLSAGRRTQKSVQRPLTSQSP